MTTNPPPSTAKHFNVDDVRKDFPILNTKVHNKPLVYLDNAATSQKPQMVINTIEAYYRHTNANVHRGIHALSDQATESFEKAREKVQHFINAKHREEIIWTGGTTEAINLVAQTWGRHNIKENDEIIISTLEHHSNIVPWQLLCNETNARLRVIKIKPDGELDLSHFKTLLNEKTKLVAVGHISNALGIVNPLQDIIKLARQHSAKVLIDGAQAVPHLTINVEELDCDFYAFSGHKMFAPTGIGVLYGKKALLESMPPWQSGGEMIERVSFTGGTTFNQLPYKFEAGTPHIAGAIGLGSAIDYLKQFERNALADYEMRLLEYATWKAKNVPNLEVIGDHYPKTSVLSFIVEGYHSQDIGMILDQQGVAVRTGHHCTMPLMQALGLTGTIRASFCFYNTKQEVDVLFKSIKKSIKLLS